MTSNDRLDVQCPKCGRKTKYLARQATTGKRFTCHVCGHEENYDPFTASEEIRRARSKAIRIRKAAEDAEH